MKSAPGVIVSVRSAFFGILCYTVSYERRTDTCSCWVPANAAPEAGFGETSHQTEVP